MISKTSASSELLATVVMLPPPVLKTHFKMDPPRGFQNIRGTVPALFFVTVSTSCCMSGCALVFALDPSGRVPRIVDAAAVQTDIDRLVTSGTPRKRAREQVVGSLGPLRCINNDEMIFRQRAYPDCRVSRCAHFAHKNECCDTDPNDPSYRAPCTCGSQRGGKGWLHNRAQQLLLQHISELQFVQWCPRRRHQLHLAGNPLWTAQLEKPCRNAANNRIVLDVAVYDEHRRRALAIEVTHTHRVSWESRQGIPYVDVNAHAVVRLLEGGGRVLVCDVGNADVVCKACAVQSLRKWLARSNTLGRETKQDAVRVWASRTRRLRQVEIGRKRRVCSVFVNYAERRRAALGLAWSALSRKLRARQACQAFMEMSRARQSAGASLLPDRKICARKAQTSANAVQKFMATSRAHQAAAKGANRLVGKPQRRETFAQRERKVLRAHNDTMQKTLRNYLAKAPAGACRHCAWTGARLGRCDTVFGPQSHWEQCEDCLRKMKGWGVEETFDSQDDADICALLNAHGMPCNASGAPSAMHFYRSALHFHRRFGREKRWETLVAHLRGNFTTTMSMPNPALPPRYRGWYSTKQVK